MNPIKFNYRPDIAASYVDAMVERVNNDPEAKPEQRAIFDDIKTMVHFAMEHLMPLQATAPGGTGKQQKS